MCSFEFKCMKNPPFPITICKDLKDLGLVATYTKTRKNNKPGPGFYLSATNIVRWVISARCLYNEDGTIKEVYINGYPIEFHKE
jgi:hypothetical protein